MSNKELTQPLNNKKTPIEIAAYIEQINMRERKYSTINKIFTLNVKRRKFLMQLKL